MLATRRALRACSTRRSAQVANHLLRSSNISNTRRNEQLWKSLSCAVTFDNKNSFKEQSRTVVPSSATDLNYTSVINREVPSRRLEALQHQSLLAFTRKQSEPSLGDTGNDVTSLKLQFASTSVGGSLCAPGTTGRRTPGWSSALMQGNSLLQSTTIATRPFQPMMHQHPVMVCAPFSTSASEEQEEKATGKPSGSASSPKSSSSSSTPSSSSSSSSFSTMSGSHAVEKTVPQRIKDGIVSVATAIGGFFLRLPGILWFYLVNPRALRDRMKEIGEATKKEANHYWMGTKLLYADLRTARQMLGRTLQGSPLTRRERKQLLRTVSDLFRLVPMSMFVLIPFMEFALPFALRLFPNMLPSTFQDSLKAEENMKRELQMRIAMAQFFQETLGDLAKEQKKQAENRRKSEDTEQQDADDNNGQASLATKQEESASSMIEFLEKARKGEMIPPRVIIKFATYFHDDLTLDNMPRMQLINMCKYMAIPPYGADSFLRFQLRNRIRTLKEDDQRILWEGIDSLTKMELREACRERGMRSTGLSKDAYKKALQQWLDLSVNQKVPVSLLIMSRTFFLREEMAGFRPADHDGSKSVAGLADAISGLDKEVVNEVVLEVATPEEKQSDPEIRKLKLEVLEQQNELILEEQKEREAAAKKKEEQQQEKETVAVEEGDEAVEEEVPSHDTGSGKQDVPTEEKLEFAKAAEAPMADSIQMETEKKPLDTEYKVEEEEEPELSSGELEAIEQLVSPDPVRSEREELKRIREAISSDEPVETKELESEEAVEDLDPEKVLADDKKEKIVSEGQIEGSEVDTYAAETIAKADAEVDKEARETTVFTSGDEDPASKAEDATEEREAEDEYTSEDKRLDNSIKRLKSKVESMVGKIEIQLSDVELKIGDRLHYLDKDMDGILTREEMANVLQQVLKRELTSEEAMEIAADMDENEDGQMTVAELARWLETNKIVKLVEEGRDADVDRIIAKQVENSKEESEDQDDESNATRPKESTV